MDESRLDWFSSFIGYLIILVFFSFFGSVGIFWMPLSAISGKGVDELWSNPYFVGTSIIIIVVFWIFLSRYAYADKEHGTKTAQRFYERGLVLSLGTFAYLAPIVVLRTNEAPQGCFAAMIFPILFTYNVLRHKAEKSKVDSSENKLQD